MNNPPLVSLLMTAYNREKYIGEAIESILSSTYQHWELIIVDDGSKDRTIEIARKYEQADKRIRVYINEKNLGDYPNRNRAASYAQGKYIKYIDADDAIYYWGLQVEVEMMEKNPEAAYGLDSIEQDDERIFPYLMSPEEAYYSNYVKGSGLFDKAPTSCIIRRDIFNAEGGFKPWRMVGDCDMWHRLSMKYKVLAMPHGIIWSRGHADSESGNLMNKPFIHYHYLLVKRGYLSRKDSPLESSYRKKILARIAHRHFRIRLKLFLSGHFSILNEIKNLDNLNIGELIRMQISPQ